jgi:phenylacetate-coenzyme A ligase PaaK-like adenylate-forming protein
MSEHSTTTLSTLSTVDDTHLDVVRGLLAAVRSVPALAERYAHVDAIHDLADLEKIPVMLKDDLQAALRHLRPRAENATTWVFQSGGSTGSPMVGYAPTGLYMREVHEHWGALDADDVVVNAWSAGKMWGAHYLVNELVDLTGCTAMSLGAITKAEYDAWFEFFADWKVTAIGGTPSVLRLLFAHARERGHRLPDLRKVLFLGEAWDARLDEDLARVAPAARRWGMFGSTETWVMATNTPDCAADTWHLMPSQLVHFGEDELLDFTSLKADGLNPVLRYRTGDAGRVMPCQCGETGLQLLGRRDGLVKFRGHLVNVADLIAQVSGVDGVQRAQLVVHEYADRGAMLEVLLLAASAAGDLAARVRDHIVSAAFGPSIVFQRIPESLTVTVADALISNERTGKTANLVTRQHS